MERKLEITWRDPALSAKAAGEMAGLEFICAIADGTLPTAPIAELMGFRLTDVEEGRVVFESEPGEQHYNPIGAVHGGMACTLFDSAMGCAVNTTLPARTGYTTLEIKVNFLRPITARTGKVFCEGRTIHVGRSTATAESDLRDEAGKLYGHATTTCMIFRAPEAAGASEGEGSA